MPILVAVRDLVFRSRIQAAAERLGIPLRLAPRDAPLADAARALGAGIVLADLGEPGMLDALRAVRAAAPVRIVGFLGHLQTDLARAATEAGVDEVLSRGELVQRLDALLASAAPGPAAGPAP
jgi:DNA-binding NarL/FixJ family response regulator